MVKLIIMDVDGVIVGNQPGVNFPYPSPKVLSALKNAREKGIPVVLCTGKFHPAIKPIVLQANLNNPHITDSGALIIDPISKKVINVFEIQKDLTSDIVSSFVTNNIKVEAFSEHGYFIQQDQIDSYTKKRSPILQIDPIITESILEVISKEKIIKIIAFARDDPEREKVENIIHPYLSKVNFVWTSHPTTGTLHYGLITSKTASKALAATTVAEELGISFEDTLGIGDTLGDWAFMNLCGYAATMEDGSSELKKLVEGKGEGKYLVAPSVNDDGILKILDYFLMLK